MQLVLQLKKLNMECTNLSYNLVGIGQENPVNEEIDRSSYAFKKIELE